MSKELKKWLLASIIPLLGVIVAIIIFLIQSREDPIFYLKKSFWRSGEKIIIAAGNGSADQYEYLHVKFDGHIFKNAGKPLKRKKGFKQRWEFDSRKYLTSHQLRKVGEHKICFSFKGNKFFSEQSITFASKRTRPGPIKPNQNDTSPVGIIVLVILIAGGALAAKVFYDKNKTGRSREVEVEEDHSTMFEND